MSGGGEEEDLIALLDGMPLDDQAAAESADGPESESLSGPGTVDRVLAEQLNQAPVVEDQPSLAAALDHDDSANIAGALDELAQNHDRMLSGIRSILELCDQDGRSAKKRLHAIRAHAATVLECLTAD